MKNKTAIVCTLFLLFHFHHLKAQLVTYSGPVEYYFEVSKTAEGEGTDGGWNWNVDINESRIITGSFFATFSGQAGGFGGMNMFKLSGIEENIEFINTINNEGNDQKYMGKDMPDNERTRKYAVVGSRLAPDKPVIKSGFLMFQNGKYRIMLSGEMEVSLSSELYSEETYPQNQPPRSVTETTTVKLPIVISGEKNSGNLNYMEGSSVLQNEQSNDCRLCMDGNLAARVHGDMECSYISKNTTSWMLVRRSDTYHDITVSYVKGDVKINGVPAKKGPMKISPGDVITTGPKSRIEIRLKDDSALRLGQKSKLVIENHIFDETGSSGVSLALLKGKMYAFINELVGKENNFNLNTRTAVMGVRGQLWKPAQTYYASVNPDLSAYFVQQEDEEKTELIEGFNRLPDNAAAYYIHFEHNEVKDISALKGIIKIEDSNHIKNKTISERTTTKLWDDGTLMSDVIITVKQ